LDPNSFLSTLFSNTLSLRSSLNVSDQVSHSYKKISNRQNKQSRTTDAKVLIFIDNNNIKYLLKFSFNLTGNIEEIIDDEGLCSLPLHITGRALIS
jgi:hypothetical protein